MRPSRSGNHPCRNGLDDGFALQQVETEDDRSGSSTPKRLPTYDYLRVRYAPFATKMALPQQQVATGQI
jgi:hypothetical protein